MDGISIALTQICNLGLNSSVAFPSVHHIIPHTQRLVTSLVRMWQAVCSHLKRSLGYQNCDGGEAFCSQIKLLGCCSKPTSSIFNYESCLRNLILNLRKQFSTIMSRVRCVCVCVDRLCSCVEVKQIFF